MTAVAEAAEGHAPRTGGHVPRRLHKQRAGDRMLVLLPLPALFAFLAFAVLPLLGVLGLSFTSWDGIGSITWTGLTNWTSVLQAPETWNSLSVTAQIVLFSVVFQLPVSLLLGVFTAGRQKYRAFLAVVYFVPLLLSSAAVAIAFLAVLEPNFGLAAAGLGFMKQNWLGDPVLARGVVVFVLSWQHIPFHTLMYQGAVRQIPASIYDAAEIDGAGRVRKFLSITLPQLKYTMITSTTLMVVGSLTYFDLIFVLTGGGPGFATRVLPLQMYQSGFQAGEMGTASVYGVLLAFLGLVIALLLQRLGGRNRQSSQLEGM